MGQAFWELGNVGDEQLLGNAQRLVGFDRRVSARLLAHLSEVEERRLHLLRAHASMFEYAMSLGMSEDEAGRRVCAARVAKRFPVIYALLDSGQLSLSVVCHLKHFITPENHEELLAGVSGLSYRKAEIWLAGRFPQPDARSLLRRLPERSTQTGALELPNASVAPAAVGIPNLPTRTAPGRFEPIALERYRVQFTASQELRDKLELAADLMAHRSPERDFAIIVDKALDLLITQLEKERFAATSRKPPRAKRAALSTGTAEATPAAATSRSKPPLAKSDRATDPGRITHATKRVVRARDGLRCSYVDDRGHRCNARSFLEHHHVEARAKGGSGESDNIRLLCRSHNQLLAEVEFGRAHMERARAERKPGSTLRPSHDSS